jgi:hypothetical protein
MMVDVIISDQPRPGSLEDEADGTPIESDQLVHLYLRREVAGDVQDQLRQRVSEGINLTIVSRHESLPLLTYLRLTLQRRPLNTTVRQVKSRDW